MRCVQSKVTIVINCDEKDALLILLYAPGRLHWRAHCGAMVTCRLAYQCVCMCAGLFSLSCDWVDVSKIYRHMNEFQNTIHIWSINLNSCKITKYSAVANF